MDGTVTITKDEYLKLLISQEELSIHRASGIDNWEGYSEGFEDWEDIQEEIRKEVEAK